MKGKLTFMIIGIGNDIVEIERFNKINNFEGFVKRYYTEEEISASKGRTSFFAGNFSEKESVSKMFGTGFRDFSLKDIEVLRDELGKPYVNLYGNAKKIADNLGITKIFVSISNTDTLISAVAVGEKTD